MIALATMLFTMFCFGLAFVVLRILFACLCDWANARERKRMEGKRPWPLWVIGVNILVGFIVLAVGLFAVLFAVLDPLLDP